jgi:hypothetical protein
MICLGCMGIMAASAFPPLQGCMDVRPVHSDLFLSMARVAELIAYLLQEKLGNDTVSKVTVLAFFLLDSRMDVFHLGVLFREFLVAVSTILLDELSLPHPWSFASSGEKTPTQEKEYSYYYGLILCA